MRRYNGLSAYILHARAYQESSLLLDIFSREEGRFSAIAKGVRRNKKGAAAILQPFVPLTLACAGRTELLSLKTYESISPMHWLLGRRLIAGLYLNELLIRLIPRFDPDALLFDHYADTLRQLTQATCEQKTLRFFEKALLKSMGYELPLLKDCETGRNIDPKGCYRFDPVQGPSLVFMDSDNSVPVQKKGLYSGKTLIALAENQFEDPKVLKESKQLMREALQVLLGNRALESRRLLV